MELAERLREENECLKNELESKENNLLIAATAGKQLLERNNELQELVDRIHAEYTVDIDVRTHFTSSPVLGWTYLYMLVD